MIFVRELLAEKYAKCNNRLSLGRVALNYFLTRTRLVSQVGWFPYVGDIHMQISNTRKKNLHLYINISEFQDYHV